MSAATLTIRDRESESICTLNPLRGINVNATYRHPFGNASTIPARVFDDVSTGIAMQATSTPPDCIIFVSIVIDKSVNKINYSYRAHIGNITAFCGRGNREYPSSGDYGSFPPLWSQTGNPWKPRGRRQDRSPLQTHGQAQRPPTGRFHRNA